MTNIWVAAGDGDLQRVQVSRLLLENLKLTLLGFGRARMRVLSTLHPPELTDRNSNLTQCTRSFHLHSNACGRLLRPDPSVSLSRQSR